MIIAGVAKILIASVHNRTDGKQVSIGPIYSVVRLESNDTDNGKFWDGAAWNAAPGSFPSATHIEAGQWGYILPSNACTGKENSSIHYTFTDSLDESLSNTVSGGGEHFVRAGVPVQPSDVEVYESEPDLR